MLMGRLPMKLIRARLGCMHEVSFGGDIYFETGGGLDHSGASSIH